MKYQQSKPARHTIHVTKTLITKFIVSTTLIGMATVLSTKIASSQTPNVRVIGRETAINNTTSVPVWPGRTTFIDFSQTNEVITYILLGDPSRTVVNTDAPLASNLAKTIFLKVIKPLRFPGATTTYITNLSVKTRSPNGNVRLYTFNIVPNSGSATSNGIAIAPISPSVEQRVLVSGNRAATLSDIELGLEIAINRRYTRANDPVVFKVREFLALARNSLAVTASAQRAGVSLNVIAALGEIGLERRLISPAPTTHSSPASTRLINGIPIRVIPPTASEVR